MAMDAGDEGSVGIGIEEVARLYGGLSVLVFAAASYDAMFGTDEMRDWPIHELASPALEMTLRVGVYGAFWSCKYAIPHMRQVGRGAVLITSSLSAMEGKPARRPMPPAKTCLTHSFASSPSSMASRASAPMRWTSASC